MTSPDITLIKSNWSEIKESLGENGAETVGRLIFENLFKDYPYMTGFFKQYGSNTEEIMKNEKFMRHAKDRVFVTFDKIINSLGNDSELNEMVLWLAKVHKPRGVKTQDLLNLGTAILSSLEQALGPNMTPELRKEWDSILVHLMTGLGSQIDT